MSKFEFRCPQCRYFLTGEEEWIGMESECPYCKKTIIIPGNETPENNDIPAQTASRKKQILKILIPSILIGLIAVVVLLWSCNSSKTVSENPERNAEKTDTVDNSKAKTGDKQNRNSAKTDIVDNSKTKADEKSQKNTAKTDIVDNSKTKADESFTYYFRLPITNDAICMELWSNLPGSIQECIITTQSGKQWKLDCEKQFSQNINGKMMYVAQFFFNKPWYFDNLLFDPIKSMELTVINSESRNNLSFVLSDADKSLFTELKMRLTTPIENLSFRLRLICGEKGIDNPVFYAYPITDNVTTIAFKLKSRMTLYYNLPMKNNFSNEAKYRGIIVIGRNDFVNIFCNDKPQKIILNPGSKDEKSIDFDSKTLQEFSEIAKQWTENQLKINFQKLSERNPKNKTYRRPINPRAKRRNKATTNSEPTYRTSGTIDDKDFKYWYYMDRIFCSKNNIEYNLIDATPRYQRRGARGRSRPYPAGIFYIK